MIQEVRISNFKCLKSLHLAELSRINLVAGKNNVGKTSLLEALFLVHDRTDPRMFLKQQTWRGVPSVQADPGSLWGPFFGELGLDKCMSVELTLNGEVHRTQFAFNSTWRRPERQQAGAPSKADATQAVMTASGSDVFPALEILCIEPNGAEARSFLYAAGDQMVLEREQVPPRLQKAVILLGRAQVDLVEDTQRLGAVIERKGERAIEEFLRIMGPVRDLRVSYTGTTQTVVCDVGLPRRVPIGYAGEGLVRLLKIILAMTWVEQGLVLVDEIENGVHYSVQEAFWRALAGAAREFDCQVIATTHSYEILRAAHAGLQSLFEPDFRYIRLERKGAETKAVTFTYENLGTALEAMWEVR